jgi:hypothetical protein
VFAWYVLAAVPRVGVLSRPDAVSAAWRPVFRVVAQWETEEPPLGGDAGVVFEFLVVGAKGIGDFHVPPVCTGDRGRFGVGSPLPMDCVEPGCDGRGCQYRIALPHDRGTSVSYTLITRVRLFADHGAVTALTWTHVVCGVDEYSVLSGNDTVACLPCPEGGDCSGATLSPLLAIAPGSANDVVLQEHVVAREGWWASQTSSGLAYYKCLNNFAVTCLQGVNGTKVQCAAGYTGVLCDVCAVGYVHSWMVTTYGCGKWRQGLP